MEHTRSLVPVMARTPEECIGKIRGLLPSRSLIDEVEIRADTWNEHLRMDGLASFFDSLPEFAYRFTVRAVREGGPSGGFTRVLSPEALERLRHEYLRAGSQLASSIDVEWDSPEELRAHTLQIACSSFCAVHISQHFFDTQPSLGYLVDQTEEILSLQGSGRKRIFPKVALSVYGPDTLETGLRYLLLSKGKGWGGTVTFMSRSDTDELARAGRIASLLYGSGDQFFKVGEGSAPGQVALTERSALEARARRFYDQGLLHTPDVQNILAFTQKLFHVS